MAIELDGGVGIDSPTYTGDGAGLSNTGAMLQFQHTLFTGTTYNSSIGSTPQAIAGVSVGITPRFANSKMKVEVRWGGEANETYNTVFNILRNGTRINLPDANGASSRGLAVPTITHHPDNNSTLEACSFFTVDTPNTTAAITYQLAVVGDGDDSMWTGRCYNGGTTNHYERISCEIIVTEIAG